MTYLNVCHVISDDDADSNWQKKTFGGLKSLLAMILFYCFLDLAWLISLFCVTGWKR